jgi:hypothetical protein
MKKIATIACLLLIAVALMDGCAVTRKLDAASIMRNMKVDFRQITLDSVEIRPDIVEQLGGAIVGGILPNPNVVAFVQNLAKGIVNIDLGYAYLGVVLDVKNSDVDTLWLRDFTAHVSLDTLMDLPLELKDSVTLIPGENKVRLSTRLPLDKRIFKFKEIREVKATGKLVVALGPEGESVPFDFSDSRTISHEEMVAIEDNVRQTILNSILNDWVGGL